MERRSRLPLPRLHPGAPSPPFLTSSVGRRRLASSQATTGAPPSRICSRALPQIHSRPPSPAPSIAMAVVLCFLASSESVRSVRICSTTSRPSTSRIIFFMDSFFFQAGSQER